MDGKVGRINAQHRTKIQRILDALEVAETLEEPNVPGWGLHQLEGKPARHSLTARANWRITFEWRNCEASQVDYEDYH